MKNQVLRLEKEQQWKSFGYDNLNIVLSSKRHDSFESLLAASGKSGLLESVYVIPISSIKRLKYNEKDSTFAIQFLKGEKVKNHTVLLENSALREPVVDELASIKGLKKEVTVESRNKALAWNLIPLLLVPLVTSGFWLVAKDAQNGKEYHATGRNAGMKQLIANLVESIGPTGVVVIGIIVFLIVVYFVYKRFTQPANIVIYQ